MEINSFDGRDSSTYRDLTQDNQTLLERPVTIKRFAGYVQPVGTSAAQGIQPIRNYFYISAVMQVGQMTGKDILSAGGQYKLGDLNILSIVPIFEANKAAGTENDFLILDGSSYSIVGSVYRVPIAGGSWSYQCVWRETGIGV